MNADRSALMSGNILEKVGKKDVGTTGQNDLPFSPCVPPEFLLESGEEHLEGPGNKKRGDRVGGTEVARDTDPKNNRHLSHSLPPPHKQTWDSSQASGSEGVAKIKNTGLWTNAIHKTLLVCDKRSTETGRIQKLLQ